MFCWRAGFDSINNNTGCEILSIKIYFVGLAIKLLLSHCNEFVGEWLNRKKIKRNIPIPKCGKPCNNPFQVCGWCKHGNGGAVQEVQEGLIHKEEEDHVIVVPDARKTKMSACQIPDIKEIKWHLSLYGDTYIGKLSWKCYIKSHVEVHTGKSYLRSSMDLSGP